MLMSLPWPFRGRRGSGRARTRTRVEFELTFGVWVIALVVTSVDHTIINVAMPRLVGDLGATAAQLQWVVAAYTVVFAGMLLTAGSMGDRFGRRHALIAGLATFLAGSVAAASSS